MFTKSYSRRSKRRSRRIPSRTPRCLIQDSFIFPYRSKSYPAQIHITHIAQSPSWDRFAGELTLLGGSKHSCRFVWDRKHFVLPMVERSITKRNEARECVSEAITHWLGLPTTSKLFITPSTPKVSTPPVAIIPTPFIAVTPVVPASELTTDDSKPSLDMCERIARLLVKGHIRKPHLKKTKRGIAYHVLGSVVRGERLSAADRAASETCIYKVNLAIKRHVNRCGVRPQIFPHVVNQIMEAYKVPSVI